MAQRDQLPIFGRGKKSISVHKRCAIGPSTRHALRKAMLFGTKIRQIRWLLTSACCVATLRVLMPSLNKNQLLDVENEISSMLPKGIRSNTVLLADGPIVETTLIHDDSRYDKLFDGGLSDDVPTRAFVWPGRNLCYDGPKTEFVASSYHPDNRYIPDRFSRRAPDRLFARRVVKSSSVARWIEGTTIVSTNFPLNETTSHTYFYITPAFHALRFAIHELNVAVDSVSILFDHMSIPKEHCVQHQFFESAFIDIAKSKRMTRDDLKSGLTCFRNVILIDRMSAPGAVRFTCMFHL
jgi:hypothetical protein